MIRRRPVTLPIVGSAMLLVALSLSLSTLVAWGVTPAAATVMGPVGSGPCTTAAGVTVIVDFTALGGAVQIRCAGDNQADGWAALQAAGFAVRDTTPAQGFVCRIGESSRMELQPTNESCIGTPPATAYWSYWHAARGSIWTYSDRGGRGRTPPPGSVDAWTFSRLDSGQTTPLPPATPVPAALTSTTTTVPPVAPAAPDPSVAGVVTTPRRPTASPPPTSTAPAVPTAPTSTAPSTSTSLFPSTSSPVAPAAPGDPTPERADATVNLSPAAASTTIDTGSGSATGTLAGVALVAALGAASVVVSRRRRPSRADG